MLKHLSKHGNSLALVIDKGILELLNITLETPLEISTDGRVLIVSPLEDIDSPERLKNALNKVNQKYGNVLKKLA